MECLHKEIDNRDSYIRRLKYQFDMMSKAYFSMVERYDSEDARKIAVKAYDTEAKYIKALLEAGLSLEEADREYIINNVL